MSDTLWHDRLAELVDADGLDFDVRDDLARGRARVRRTRVAAGAGAVLVAGLMSGVVLLTGGMGAPQSSGPAATVTPAPSVADPLEESTAPSVAEPDQARVPKPTHPTLDGQERAIRRVLEAPPGEGRPEVFTAWRNELFATTRSVLDPSGGHLDYATQSMQSGWSNAGVSIGITMGWTNPGRAGEGKVAVELSTDTQPAAEACESAGVTCARRVEVDGAEMHVGRTSGDGFVVLHQRRDGVRVLVVVDRLFGNNGRVPVSAMDVTRQDVYRLVQDDRLDLPKTP